MTDQEKRWMQIGKAIERACEVLPDDVILNVELENGSGGVCLYLPEDDGPGLSEWDAETFADKINMAIDYAIEQVSTN
jgi:hypothetical protein